MKIQKCIRAAVAAVCVAAGFAAQAVDIGFVAPYEDWRTPMQLAAPTVKDTFYEPVSVFTPQDVLQVSFGWTAKGVSSALPPIKFAIVDVSHRKLVEWVEPASSFRTQTCAPEYPANNWSGGYACEVLKFLDPGDYRLEAEIDPFNTSGETPAQRADNTAIFRFAVRNEALTFKDVFTESAWEGLTAIKGNDFAQEPFASVRGWQPGVPAVQFGPYVPMDGKTVSSRKKPLDLVFVVDATGSMSGCIQGLLRNISVFIDQLFKGDPAKGIEPIDDLRIKLVSFGDDYDRNSSYGWYQESAFSSDLTYLKSKLSDSRFFGGYNGSYNGAESPFEAIWYVVNGWVPDTPRGCYQKTWLPTPNPFRQLGEAARAIILFTDEPAWAPKGSGFHKYPAMMAIGCPQGEYDAVDKLAESIIDACVDLTIVTDNVLRGWDWGFKQYNYLIEKLGKPTTGKDAAYIHNVSTLSQFTQSFTSLQALADKVSASVPTVVVEPTLKASTSEMGTLSFKWKNDTTAGTNNVFSFTYTDNGVKSAVETCESTNNWDEVVLEFTADGLHTFEWNYRKIGYDGDVADCGLISDVRWLPCETQLKIDPVSADYKFDAAPSNAVTVTCNQNWTVSVESDAEYWVHLDRQPTVVRGNGSFTYSIDENTTYGQRTATITVTATSVNGVKVMRTHTITQAPSPYQENGEIQLIDVGIKPRWPWNSLVDIDFRVIAPAKNTPVTLDIKGIDCQAEGFGFKPVDGKEYDCVTNSPMYETRMVEEDFCQNVIIDYRREGNEKKEAVFTCPSSGVYRVTLDLGKWNSAMWTAEYKFHTPKFRVLFSAMADCNGKKSFSYLSDPIRIDTRVGEYGTGGCDKQGNPIVRGSESGGIVITGTEKIGHPDGRLDPFEWDSTTVADGRYDLTSLFSKEYQVGLMTNLPVVVRNGVKVEGGVISDDTIWAADVVHLVRDNVFVMKDARLTIEDGAVVKFCDNSVVYVQYEDNYESLNLSVKGAYVCTAYDPTVGGDTMFDLSITNLISNIGNGGQLGAWDVFHDKDFFWGYYEHSKGRMYSSLYYGNGIRSLQMFVPDSSGNYNLDTPRWMRTYTRYQKVGDTLPRPSAAGESFVGWYETKPERDSDWWKSSKVGSEYVVLRSSSDDATRVIYAFSANPEDPTWQGQMTKTLADPVEIALEYYSVPYNGAVQKPAVKLVKVGETEINPANYTVTYSDPSSKSAGVYTATINFKYDYTNSPSATYAIMQRSGEDAVVALEPASEMYTGSVVTKPKLTVTAGNQTLVAGRDYDVGWSAGDWLSVGTYRATVELKGNYYGTVHSDVFRIVENPYLEVVFFDSDEKAKEHQAKMAAGSRILYVSGVTNGPERAATCAVIDSLKNDPTLRSFVLNNFVCRYDDYATVGSNKCATAYAPGFSGPLAFMGALGFLDASQCVQATNGYVSSSALLTFLEKAKTAPEDASAARVTWSSTTSFIPNGAVQRPDASKVTYCNVDIPSNNYSVISTLPGETAPVESKESGTYEAKVVFDPSVPLAPYPFGLKGVARDVCTFVIKVSLPENPQQSEIAGILSTWQDTNLTAKVMTPEAYAKFRSWVERMGGLSDEATYNKLVNSQYAYISSRVSEILAEAQLLTASSQVELKIAEFKAGSPCELVFELKLGGTPQELQAAKEALAGMVLVGAELDKMAHPDPKDIEAELVEPDRNKVKLTVPPPVDSSGKPTPSGFMKMKIE